MASAPPSASRIFIILAVAEGELSRGLPPRGPETHFFLRRSGERGILQLCGGGVLQPCGGRRTAAAWTGCSCPSSTLGGSRAMRGWLLSPASRRGRTSTTLAWSAASVVSCSVPGTLAQLALAPPPMLPPAAWSGRGCPSTARETVAPHAGRACLRPSPRHRLHLGIVQDVARR
jgi:hypothetical protein